MAWYKLDEEGNIEGLLKPLAPLINYVARLNGADQYWQLSEEITIAESTPFRIKIQAELDRDNTRHVFSNYKVDDFRLLSLSQLSAAQLFVGDNSGFYSGISPSEVVSTVEVVGDGSSYVVIIDGVAASSALQVGVITFNSIGGKWGVGTSAGLGIGVHSDLSVEINGVLTHEIPLTNKAQGAYQVATTTPLGDNLYTQEVIENPERADDQWSYLGDGRWYLNGDGSVSVLQFDASITSGYLSFEIESISGGGALSCTGSELAETEFNTTGVKTYYYKDLATEGSVIQFKRRYGTVNTVIKNIKHYDTDGVLVATMVGYTPDVWEVDTQ